MLLFSTSRANVAFTLLGLARTQKPGSTASVTLAGKAFSFYLYVIIRNLILTISLHAISFQDTGVMSAAE